MSVSYNDLLDFMVRIKPQRRNNLIGSRFLDYMARLSRQHPLNDPTARPWYWEEVTRLNNARPNEANYRRFDTIMLLRKHRKSRTKIYVLHLQKELGL